MVFFRNSLQPASIDPSQFCGQFVRTFRPKRSIVVWTVCSSADRHTVNMFNDEEDRKSLNFDLDNRELNIMDPSTLLGRPLDFIDGFIRWQIPCGLCYSNETNDAMVFTYIESTFFGAAQTLLAGEHPVPNGEVPVP